MNKEQARKLHEEAYVIDGLNASDFFNEAVLRRILQGGGWRDESISGCRL